MISWETKTPFRELIEQDESITSVLTKKNWMNVSILNII